MGLNKVFLEGNLVRDAETRHTSGGTALCKFAIAVSEYRKDAEDKTHFFDLVLWGSRAEALGQYLTKGKGVIVEAKAVQNSWTQEDGGRRSKVEFHVDGLSFKGSRGGAKGTEVRPQDESFEDDIPF